MTPPPPPNAIPAPKYLNNTVLLKLLDEMRLGTDRWVRQGLDAVVVVVVG